MAVSLETYRNRIGLFNCRGQKEKKVTIDSTAGQSCKRKRRTTIRARKLFLLFILLLINLENPITDQVTKSEKNA